MKPRKQQFKRFLAGIMTGVMITGAAGTQLPASVVNAAPANGVVGEVTVNPEVHYQTLKGWGTSMCWWGNVIGSWGDKDFNENGKPDREEIAELAFSPEYLNLNIVRYNVGGGDKENSSIKRVEGLVPGWTKDMTGTADGTGTFNATEFYNKKTEDMSDAGQLWMLEQANKWREETADKNHTENDIINEVFSNSPPYYMTNSGSSTGGVKAASNLKEDCYDDFALYMARAAKWIENDLSTNFSSHVDYIEPMNEPDTNYWENGSLKQEGCTFKPGKEQSDMMLAMKEALSASEFGDSLKNVKLTGTDETDLARAISSFNSLTNEAKNSITTIGAHTYSGSDSERNTLRKLAAANDKELWMSEITKGNYDVHSHDSMLGTNAKGQSEGIMADLKYMQPSAWVAWLVADSEYECLQMDESWGLIHCVFESDGPVADYHKKLVYSNGSKKKDVPDEGYWVVTKQFYTMMQYSKYLKAGYTMIDIGDSNMCAAISPDGKELVIVAQNFSKERSTTIDLSAFETVADVKLYRTSDTEDCKEIEGVSVTDKILNVTLPKNSVSTYVISAETDANSYKEIVDADVQKPSTADLQVSDNNKFTYTGTWDGLTTTDMGATATFTFTGTRAALYAAKGPKGTIVNVSVDGKTPEKVSLYEKAEIPEALICDTGMLTEGAHTIKVSIDSTVTEDNGVMKGTSLTMSHAEIIHGTVSLASGSVIRKVEADDGALWITFDKSGNGTYTIKYGTSEDNLNRSMITGATTAKIPELTNGETYYIQVVDSDRNVSNIVTGSPKIPEGSLLYSVDIGTSKIDAITEDNPVGIYNSVLEQQYGRDPKTGKMWGYVEGTGNSATETYWADDNRMMSMRQCMAGLEYKFELPEGTYNVTIGMLDHWPGGRFTDIVINGDIVDTEWACEKKEVLETRTYKVENQGDEMIVKAVRSSSNENNSPGLAYIEISAFDEADMSIIGMEELPIISTISGVIPHLPATVNAKTANDDIVPVIVSWETVTEDKFSGDDFDTVKVKGTAVTEDGAEYEVNQTVQIVPENVQYFIDCNWAGSSRHAALHAAVGLKNEVADKAYANGSWGYLMTAEGYGGSDTYTFGWYNPAGDKIQYKLPMEAGDYAVTFGFNEWWYDDFSPRPMVLKAYAGDTTIDLGNCGGAGVSKRFAVTKNLTVGANADVTLSVERGNGDAPILSWISIQSKGVDRSSLKAQLNEAGKLDASEYSEVSYAAVSEAVEAAMPLLLRADSTQAKVDEAAASIRTAISKLDVSTESRENLQKELEAANSIDDLSIYTDETVAAFNAAVEKVTTLLEKDSISRKELEDAKAELKDAKRGLEIKPENKPKEDLRVDLSAWIYRAENLNSILYTEASWSSLQTKVTAVKTVYNNEAATAQQLADAIKGIQDAVAALEKVSGSGDDNKKEVGNYNVAVSKSILEKNDYVLYTVNCGTPDPYEVPGGEVMGLLQSRVDQQYGIDPKTKASWGYAAADANSEAVRVATDATDAEDSGSSYLGMSNKVTFDKEKSGLRYAFEVLAPSDNYEGILKTSYDVTVAFKNPGTLKPVNISLEGKTVEEGLNLPRNTWITKTYRVVVTDGELNVMVSNPNRTSNSQDPIINAITIKAVAGTPDVSKLQASVDRGKTLLKRDYTESTWKIFEEAYEQAEALIAKPGNDQSVVDECQSKLDSAIDGLKTVTKVSSIQLSGDVTKLAKGKRVTLNMTVAPENAANKAVTWTSSNGSVATVANGVVTGKGSGTATITATAADGSNVKGTYQITVVNHAVTKITLKSGTTGLAAGKKLTVTKTVKTNGKTANTVLKWSSSNPKYATVDSKGKVTAKSAGAGKTVTITAKATDGSNVSGKVTIKIVKHAVKKITLKCNKKVKAGKKVTVKATIKTTGKTANKKLAWTTSNKKYATVNSKGKVTTKKTGKGKTVTITAKATDGSGKKASVKIKILK